jgi:hypothetical protein
MEARLSTFNFSETIGYLFLKTLYPVAERNALRYALSALRLRHALCPSR